MAARRRSQSRGRALEAGADRRDRSGHHRHDRARARRARGRSRPRVRRASAALPEAGLGRASRRGDLGDDAARARGWVERRGAGCARRDRHHESARNRAPVGPADVDSCGARHRLAGSPRRRILSAAAAPARRSAAQRSAVRRSCQTTGLRFDPYFSATKVEWMLHADSALRPRARRGEIAFGTVDSWLVWKLTGGAVHATDPTNASRTLLYDIRRRRWDPALTALFGVPPATLPD